MRQLAVAKCPRRVPFHRSRCNFLTGWDSAPFGTKPRADSKPDRPKSGDRVQECQMPIRDNARSAEAIRRKLRALAAVFLDPAATEHEKANAKVLKGRLETQLGQKPTSEGTWTGIMFQLGRGVREIASSRPAKSDWTDHAFRLGRIIRRGIKK